MAEFIFSRDNLRNDSLLLCSHPSLLSTILQVVGDPPKADLNDYTDLRTSGLQLMIVCVGGDHCKGNEKMYFDHNLLPGERLTEIALKAVWGKLRTATRLTAWSIVEPAYRRVGSCYSCDELQMVRAMKTGSNVIITAGEISIASELKIESQTAQQYADYISPENFEIVAAVFHRLEMQFIIETAKNAILFRPEIIEVGGLQMAIDDFILIFATYMIKFYSIRVASSRSGTSVFAELLLEIASKSTDAIHPLWAFDAIAKKCLYWVPNSETLLLIVAYVAAIYGDCIFPHNPTFELIIDRRKKNSEPVRRRSNRGTRSFWEFISDRRAFFYSKGQLSVAAFQRMLESENPDVATQEVNDARRRYYEDLMSYSREDHRLKKELPGRKTVGKFPIEIGPGWLASIVGPTLVDEPNDIIGCLNFRNLYDSPTIMRGGKQVNTDDLSKAQIKTYGQIFFERFKQPGLKLSCIPSTFKQFENLYLKDVSGVPKLMRKRILNKELVWEVVHECSLGFLRCEVEVPVLALTDINRFVDAETRFETMTGNYIVANVGRVLGTMFSKLSKYAMRRASALLNHFEDTLNFTGTPVLYGEDIEIFKIMCTFAQLCPGLLHRTNTTFKISNGPIYWNIVHPLIQNAGPVHFEWNVERSGTVVEVREDGVCIDIPCAGGKVENDDPGVVSAIHEFYPERPIKYSEQCEKCKGPYEVCIKHKACKRVAFCAKCGGGKECPGCGERTTSADYCVVKPALRLRIGDQLRPEPLPPLFPWQSESINKLTSFAKQTEVVWLSPGAGKTRIVTEYIRWCVDHECMTKYFLWVTPGVAIENLSMQLEAAGIPYAIHNKRGTLLIEGVVNIVKTHNFVYSDRQHLAEISPDLTFVLDEFHLAMSRATQVSELAMLTARIAARCIPMSGTIYKNKDSPAQLARFLSLCVDFEVNDANFKVALGLMNTYKIPSRSVIRREVKRVVGGFGNIERDAQEIEDAMFIEIQKSIHEDIGVVVGVRDTVRAAKFAERLREAGIDAICQSTTNPISLSPNVAPDVRGPGFVAKKPYSESDDVILHGTNACEGKRTFFNTYESVTSLARRWITPREENESHLLPQVVIVIQQERAVTGFDLNRYRRMFIATLPMNDATRCQFEGRIDRSNNDSPFIEYTTFYLSEKQLLFETHELERARSDALRDAQSGDDAGRRIYDSEWFKERLRDSDEANARARRAETNSGPSKIPAKVLIACAFFDVKFTDVPDALRSAIRRVWRAKILEFHPDKWATASPADNAKASATTVLINEHYAVIEEYYLSITRREYE